jgi:selenocysteine lyase/cysteine desulfurase
VIAPDDLRASPNPLAAHYSAGRVGERLLLTGHSHQAWPDVAREGQLEAFDDATRLLDEKWDAAFAKADAVRAGFGRLLGVPPEQFALGANTHELIVRLLSALDLRARPRLVTTGGEFHTIRRQLQRLAEGGVEVEWVSAEPADTLAQRLACATDRRTAAVFVSAVLFETAAIVSELAALAETCEQEGAELLVDVYHALGVLPVSLPALGLGSAWVVGGGYKYLQLGEGNCFLRLPAHAERLRPLVTGWFAEFDALAEERVDGRVAYGQGPARFAGATYDPTSHYRAARVFGFFAEQGLRPELLREVSQRQVGLLAEAFDALDAPEQLITRDRATPLSAYGGFLALRTPHARALHRELLEQGLHTDFRGEYLRLGPAPYVSDVQLERAVELLGEALGRVE